MKYKLLKDLPGIKAGTIFKEKDGDILRYTNYLKADETYYVYVDYAKRYPDFFEPINEREVVYPENLMNGFFISYNGEIKRCGLNYEIFSGDDCLLIKETLNEQTTKNQFIIGNRFPTEEKAEAYIDLKRDVARFDTSGKYILYDISGEDWLVRIPFSCLSLQYVGDDFMLPPDATNEEKENRVKLLKNYYGF